MNEPPDPEEFRGTGGQSPDRAKRVADAIESLGAEVMALHTWVRRVSSAMLGVAAGALLTVLIAVGGLVYSLERFASEDRQDEARQRLSRIAANAAICRGQNRTNESILDYLRRRDPAGLEEERMRAASEGRQPPFPIEADCEERAVEIVDRPPPVKPAR